MFKFRMRILTGLLLAGFLLVLGRLAQLQLVRGAHYRELMERGRTRERLVPAMRGAILDRNGQPLALDVPSLDLAVRLDRLELQTVALAEAEALLRPAAAADGEGEAGGLRTEWETQQRRSDLEGLRTRLEAEPWVQRLARRTGRPAAEIAGGLLEAFEQVARKWARPSTPLTVLRGLDEPVWTALRAWQEDAFHNAGQFRATRTAVASRTTGAGAGAAEPETGPGFPGLVCTVSVRRRYPEGELLAHVLGTLTELMPAHLEELRADGTLADQAARRAQLWKEQRQGLDELHAAALEELLGEDPRRIEALSTLLPRLRGLDVEQRRRAADLGLADPVRWAERPPRVVLCEAERLWLGCGMTALRANAHATLPDLRVGETGVESWYNERLRGKAGLNLQTAAADSEAEEPGRLPVEGRPREGDVLALTISAPWQRAAERALAATGRDAAVAVLDCQTGEVLALASYPTFDPNAFVPPRQSPAQWARLKGWLADPRKPLLNRCTSEQYPLGSVMKPLVSVVALEMGVLDPADTITDSTGYLQEGHNRYYNDGHHTYGTVNFWEAMRRSCNVYFYRVGARVGVESLAPFAHAVGFGRRTGLDLPGETSGTYPDRAWRMKTFPHSPWDQSWSRGKDYHLAIGQGYLTVTPLQVACMMALFANGGYAVTPRLWLDAPAPPRRSLGLSARALGIVNQGLDEVVNCGTPGAKGTAFNAFHGHGEPLAVRVAGKTGTAEVGRAGVEPHAWFAGYAPVGAPQVAFSVLIENGGHGGDVAAPIAYRILKDIYGTRRVPRALAQSDEVTPP